MSSGKFKSYNKNSSSNVLSLDIGNSTYIVFITNINSNKPYNYAIYIIGGYLYAKIIGDGNYTVSISNNVYSFTSTNNWINALLIKI